jgi:biotin transport system substrate-specific component
MTTSAHSLSLAITHDRRYAIAGVLGFVVALAVASQVAIPLPGTPVPITLQPMVVVLAGMMLGPTLGVASMVLYLALGALGLPVFAPVGAPGIARFFGPTGGYLIAYPVAAYTAGFLAQRFPSLLGRLLAAVLGIAVLFVGGLAQLTILTGSFARAVALGMTPFAILDVVKAFAAALIARPRVRSAQD